MVTLMIEMTSLFAKFVLPLDAFISLGTAKPTLSCEPSNDKSAYAAVQLSVFWLTKDLLLLQGDSKD